MVSPFDTTSPDGIGTVSPLHLVDGQFAIDFSRPLAGAAGPRVAFAATGGQAHPSNLMAIQVRRGWPARMQAVHILSAVSIRNLLVPLGAGAIPLPTGDIGYFVVSAAPPGLPLSVSSQTWSERELIDRVMRPIAAVLQEMQTQGVTHRAIRPDNVYVGAGDTPVTLGCAWDGPAACHQPAVCEPPYSAVCDPAGQGEGVIADDVYALGVLMVWLAVGHDPMAGLDVETVIQRKLELGSYAAVVGEHHLPPFIADLVRGMLADDPEHRPTPILLSDPSAARARRTAMRSTTRPQRSFEMADISAWTPRMLALAIHRHPARGLEQLRNGTIDQWLRRVVGDAAMATRLDEMLNGVLLLRNRNERQGDARTLMKAVAILDPLAPICWRGTAIWPDGLGPALNNALQATADPTRASRLIEVAGSDVVEHWSTWRPGRSDQRSMQLLTRNNQKWLNGKPAEGGVLRLCYALNPLIPCDSPWLARAWVTRLAEVLPAMEAAAVLPDGDGSILDRHLVTFIAVRRDERIDREVGSALGAMSISDPLSSLRLLVSLQANSSTQALPRVASWIVRNPGVTETPYKSHSRRQRLATQMAAAVLEGDLKSIMALLSNPIEAQDDAQGRSAAKNRMAVIDYRLAGYADGNSDRQRASKQLGHDVAGGVGLLACGIALALVLFS